MELTGKNLIGGQWEAAGGDTYKAVNPAEGESLEPAFYNATPGEIEKAMALAASAFDAFRAVSAAERAAFLRRIADEIESLGDELPQRARAESALPLEQRLAGERARTTGQLRMFAALIEEGSWVEARIDRAIPDRKPLPKPDVRRMLLPIGPVVVFGASNFPLAFSTAGGDTASALAAGCPVVCKAHPSHPGTAEMTAEAMRRAAEACGMPKGVFSMLHGAGHAPGLALVSHPAAKAVGFTGSLRGGRALFDTAMARPEPIPVYAEMGSVNPVFILPGALQERGDAIAEGLVQSVTLGVGQFCTNPGLVFGLKGEGLDRFGAAVGERIAAASPGVMLNDGIRSAYEKGLRRLEETTGVSLASMSRVHPDVSRTQAGAVLLAADAEAFLREHNLREEVFGPATVLLRCGSIAEMEAAARGMEGSLTATIHAAGDDLERFAGLVSILRTKVGRLVFNGFPTGVEVCPSMHHGGPYPATTNSHFTSVGAAAILRWARPVAFQNLPQALLPAELRDRNEKGIMRLVDGQYSREDC